MADDSADILLFSSGTYPKIIARCAHKAESAAFVVESLSLGEGALTAKIVLAGSSVAIPEELVEDRRALKPVKDITTDALKRAYAALCARLTDLEFDRSTQLFGLPASARYSVKAAIALPSLTALANPPEIGLRAQVHLELEAPAVKLRGSVDFDIVYSAQVPKLSGTFGWPTFGFKFSDLDFSKFSLIDLPFVLPNVVDGWLPQTTIHWDQNAAPKLSLTLDRGLSLKISADGKVATGIVSLNAKDVLKIDAFSVEGPVDGLDVTLGLTPGSAANVTPGSLPLGPLTIEWTNVEVSASLKPAAPALQKDDKGDKATKRAAPRKALGPSKLVIITKVGSLVVKETANPAELIEFSFEIETSYDTDGKLDTALQNFTVVKPTGSQVAAFALREIGQLKRILLAIPLPQTGPFDPCGDRIMKFGRAVIAWLGSGLGAVGGALLGLGKGAASFADWIFGCLAEVAAGAPQLAVELRWDGANRKLKQIVVWREGAPLAPREFELGELKIAFPGVSHPMLVFDLVDHWMAVAVAPGSSPFEAVFSTDLWVGGSTGTTAVRGADPDPLVTVTAKLVAKHPDPDPIALVLLCDGRARFFQSLGGGPAEPVGNGFPGVAIGSPLVPGDIDPDVDVGVAMNKDKLTAIFPVGSGSAGGNSSAPTVKVLDWRMTPGSGTVKKIEADLEVVVGAGSKPTTLKPTITGRFDLRTFELRFDALEIPIPAPKPIEFFGATATIVENVDHHGFVLRLDEAPSIALATGARAELRFDAIGEGEDVLTFDASGPKGLALGTAGLDLDAKVRQNPIRLPGLDTPFRFTGGGVQVERGNFLSAAITGSGTLPPALLGEAKIDAGIQLKREKDGPLIVESATARLERAGEPLVCESTRFHFELTHVGLGFKVIDEKIQFFGELTGSATFRPHSGEFSKGLLSRLPQIRVDFERAPIAGDGRALTKAMKFQIPINPPARAKLFDLFEFELRGIGFLPAYNGWSDLPPTLSLSGQARMTESFDVIQPSFEAHQIYITRPEAKGTLPRVRMDELGLGLRVGAMGEFSGTAIAVDETLPSLFKPNVLPANVTAKGFLASGRLMLKGWAAMSGNAGFLELSPKDAESRRNKRLSFYVYVQQEQLSEAIPTPVGTLYLREVGFGFGFRYTLAALAQTDQLTDPRDIIRTLDPLSKTQGDLSSFASWQPEIDGDRLTLAMRALFSVTTASSASVYNAEKEKDLDNPVLFDVVAAMRSDLTFLLSARAWIAVNYADWLTGPKDWREKPILRGYIYISAPKKIFLGRLILDPKGHIGEHPKLPQPLIDALGYVKSATATIYITPDLFHQELGWPYELQLALGDPDGKFHAALSGGMVVRIEDGAVLHGIAFKAEGHVRLGGRTGGSVGASAEAVATFALDGKFIAFVSVARPAESLFYGRLALALALEFSISFWVDTKFLSLSASWDEKIDVEIDLELAVGPSGIGGHARASLSLRRFGRGLRLGVSLGFNEGKIGAARGRVERFMALGLGATVPDPATGLPPLPETQRRARAERGDQELEKLADRRDSLPLLDSEAATEPKPVQGDPITGCDFWAIVMPIRGKRREALLHLVPRDKEMDVTRLTADQAFFGAHPHGDFFVSPVAAIGTDGHRHSGGRYDLSEQAAGILAELKVPSGKPGDVFWDKQVDPKTGATLADLVASGFLLEDGGRLTQPMLSPTTSDEKRETLGSIEARGALIGQVAETARLLAANWDESKAGEGAASDFDPRWFGLTYRIGDEKHKTRTLAEVLERIFPTTGDGTKPRGGLFTVAKSDVATGPALGAVELFNPLERWFENAQPRLAEPRAYMHDQTIRLAWDLEPRWGAAQSRYDDPEFHLMHYAVQRHIELSRDNSRHFQAAWVAKGAETIDLVDGIRLREHQVIDRLENLPDALRKSLLLMLGTHADEADVLQRVAHEEAVEAWWTSFGAIETRGKRTSVKLVYTVVAIDNSGTRADPSPPIELTIWAPLPLREQALSKVSLSFDYIRQKPDEEVFPSNEKDRPSRLTLAMSKADWESAHPPRPVRSLAAGRAKALQDLSIELLFDFADAPRSGIFGADLLDADRHRHRVISPDTSASVILKAGGGPAGSLTVEVMVIDPDQNDPAVIADPKPYYLPGGALDALMKLRRSTQIYARWQQTKARPAPWTRCDLKLRISRNSADKTAIGKRYDDFIAPIAEFEQPRQVPHLLMPGGETEAEQGILHRMSPSATAVLDEAANVARPIPDAEQRRAIRLAWKARPLEYCDKTIAEPDRIGGFDLFVASRDREPDTVMSAENLARLAVPLGRVLVKPSALLNSEPAQIEDFSKLDVAYPSAAAIAAGRGWFSAAESRLIWPKAMLRRSLMLVPDEGLIGEIFAKGRPQDLKLRLETLADSPSPLMLGLAPLDDDTPHEPLAKLGREKDGWRPIEFKDGTEATPRALRQVLQRLVLNLEGPHEPTRARFKIAYGQSVHEIEFSFSGELHPVLADFLDLLRYAPADFAEATGYRRYEPVLEGAPAPAAGETEDKPEGLRKPVFAQLLSDTAEGADKAGWAALRQLGLAVGFRLWDTETADWVSPAAHRSQILRAWKRATTRYWIAPGSLGAPFLEQLFDPEELYVLGGEDSLRQPRSRALDGTPLLQISLRPFADRLLEERIAGDQRCSIHYCTLTLEKAQIDAVKLDEAFASFTPNEDGRAYLELMLPAAGVEPCRSVWIGSKIEKAENFEPEPKYSVAPGRHAMLARIVVAGRPDSWKEVLCRLRDAILAGSSDPGAFVNLDRLLWSPVDNTAPPATNPYLRFDPIPPDLAAFVERPGRGPDDGRQRLKALAARRFDVPEAPGADEALALQRWERRFLEMGLGARLGGISQVGLAFATMDAPAALRRAPNAKGQISILYLDEGQLGLWRRFYVRPFGRYDHLAQASGWLGAIEGQLDAADFGKTINLENPPWVDVALARSRELPKPVLLASAYAPEAKALVLVAARSDQDVLASANVSQAGAAQMGSVDIGFHCHLDPPRKLWADQLLPSQQILPELLAEALDPVDTRAFAAWLLARALPPKPAPDPQKGRAAPDLPLPDLWRGATAVAAYDLPYFFSYSAQMAATAGVAVSAVTEAELPSPWPVDYSLNELPQWREANGEIQIRLPLARFADCMDKDSQNTWYRPGEPAAPLFELPDPGIVYRIGLRSPFGEMWSSEIDVEAVPRDAGYVARVTGQLFDDAICGPLEQVNGSWWITVRTTSRAFDAAAASALAVVPIRQMHAMPAISIGEAP